MLVLGIEQLNMCPLDEQPVLLNAEQFLQAPTFYFISSSPCFEAYSLREIMKKST